MKIKNKSQVLLDSNLVEKSVNKVQTLHDHGSVHYPRPARYPAQAIADVLAAFLAGHDHAESPNSGGQRSLTDQHLTKVMTKESGIVAPTNTSSAVIQSLSEVAPEEAPAGAVRKEQQLTRIFYWGRADQVVAITRPMDIRSAGWLVTEQYFEMSDAAGIRIFHRQAAGVDAAKAEAEQLQRMFPEPPMAHGASFKI